MKIQNLISSSVLFIALLLVGCGNNFKTVKIGNQVWMAENLNVGLYRNGDIIPEAKTYDEWAVLEKTKTGCWCYYNNDTVNGKKYGKLYNWYAVNDNRGISPAGWHVPTDNEWTVLVNFLGGANDAGGKMQLLKTTHYIGGGCIFLADTTMTNVDNFPNKSGFTALLGGFYYSGSFHGIYDEGIWWSATEADGDAWYRIMFINNPSIDRNICGKSLCFSVRCVKD
jgi:uncharacterized protein (TIGR02145 family)